MTRPTVSFIFLILILVCPLLGNAQTNVRVIADKATIYTKPNTKSTFHISAQKGDIFEVKETHNGWHQIELFSGGKRYVKHSKVEIIQQVAAYPSDPSFRSKLCTETEEARNKASKNAMSKYPNEVNQQGLYEQLLFDQYMLSTFRTFKVPATHYSKLVECINDPLPMKPLRID